MDQYHILSDFDAYYHNIHATIATKNHILPCNQATGNSVLSIHMLKTKKEKEKISEKLQRICYYFEKNLVESKCLWPFTSIQ